MFTDNHYILICFFFLFFLLVIIPLFYPSILIFLYLLLTHVFLDMDSKESCIDLNYNRKHKIMKHFTILIEVLFTTSKVVHDI